MEKIFSIDLGTFIDAIVTMFNVGLLFMALSYLMFEPVKKVLKNRTERIKNEFDKINEEKDNALLMKNTYENKIKEIESEAGEILAAARKKTLEREKEILNQAKKEAEQIVIKAKADVELEKVKAMDAMKTEMVALATVMAEKIIKVSINEEVQANLIEEALEEMSDATWIR